MVGHRLKETVSVQYQVDRVFEWPLARLERFPPAPNWGRISSIQPLPLRAAQLLLLSASHIPWQIRLPFIQNHPVLKDQVRVRVWRLG